MADWPRITGRRVTELSPYVEIIERKVEFAAGSTVETYHAVGQADYIAIVARTPSGEIPLVRQFRPAIERFTWELPAGLVDPGEEPAETAQRELLEETGYPTRKLHPLGTTAPCTSRFSNWMHSFFVETGERNADFQPEPGMEIRLVDPQELRGLISAGEFISQHHIGALFQASLQSFLRFS
jgi:8-oxo-dGTP pyrophosphatase MutT (NUDIX family)